MKGLSARSVHPAPLSRISDVAGSVGNSRYCARMQAAVQTRYGPPEVVRIAEVEKPTIADNEVLVKVMPRR